MYCHPKKETMPDQTLMWNCELNNKGGSNHEPIPLPLYNAFCFKIQWWQHMQAKQNKKNICLCVCVNQIKCIYV